MNTLHFTIRTLALGALLALGGAALAQGPHGAGHDHGHGAPASPEEAGGMGMMGGAMGAGMAMHPPAADEAGFLAHMIPHHQEAVDSARALLEVTERPELRTLAEAIIASQTAEIEAMRGWLADWHPDAPVDVDYAPMMRDPGPDASVDAVERAFLEDMVMHHMMAVRDARLLLMQGLAEHDEVADLAQSIVSDQLNEIDQMRAWLAEWFDVTMPMGRMLGAAGVDMGMMGDAPMMRGGMGMMHGQETMPDGMGMMHGRAGMLGQGMMPHHEGMHGAHHRSGAPVIPVDAAEAARLAQAFLDGRGDGTVTGVEAPMVTFEVHFDDDEGGGVLIVDARTGAVRIASER